MKRFFALIIALIAFASISAHAQVSVGAGYLNSNFLESTPSESSASNMNGFYIECDYRTEIVDDYMGFSAGFRYTYGVDKYNGGDNIKGSWSEHYMDIPVTIDLGIEFSENFRAFVFAGPTFSFGVGSLISLDGSNKTIDIYELIDMMTPKDVVYNKFDLMIGLGVGVDLFETFRIKAEFDQGLLNRLKGIDGLKATRNLVKVGVAYIF